MAINPIKSGIDLNAVQLRRPPFLDRSFGFVPDSDATIKGHLDQLNALLGKRVFGKRENGEGNATITKMVNADLDGAQVTADQLNGDHWTKDSLLDLISNAVASPDQLTLAEYIDLVPDLSQLKYPYEQTLTGSAASLDYNTRTVVNAYPSIRDFLLIYAYQVGKVTEINGLQNFVLNNENGAKRIVRYAVISAARSYILSQQLAVPDYTKDDSPVIQAIVSANLTLQSSGFIPALDKIIKDFLANGPDAATEKLIDDNKAIIGTVVDPLRSQLIAKIKASRVKITAANAQYFLPLFITQLSAAAPVAPTTDTDTATADEDFDVEFLQDDDAIVQISRSAVKCAAQLFYGMVLGDELEVFDTVNFFTHNYLLRGGIEIQDATLRDDLQSYVFSNRFFNVKANKLADRTRPGERQMFYRQVFNTGGDLGDAQLNNVIVPNPEFPGMWKVLMLETAKFIERAQTSPNPDNYVSKQNVMQAVEDLQYNLSTHCIGMVNVVTPLIYAELDFVIRRIFMHDEVKRQIAPAGATWWRVVETLYMAMRNQRPKATVLYQKAKLGNDILRKIADYNPATFQDPDAFSAFISDVEAFITTQSILQGGTDADSDTADQSQPALMTPSPLNRLPFSAPPMGIPGMPGMPGMPAPAGASASNGSGSGSEWDF
ncbi:MAG TPA: hypothetical protein VGJ18_02815 [Gemmatimonadaceae bacterium]|jgi:hypothetical protein